jgi:hypothetical protein
MESAHEVGQPRAIATIPSSQVRCSFASIPPSMEPATAGSRAGSLGRRKEIAMKAMVTIAGLAALALLGAGCTSDYGYDRPYYGYSQGYYAPNYSYYAPRRSYYAPAGYGYGYGYPRSGYYSPYYGSGPGVTFSASFPQG